MGPSLPGAALLDLVPTKLSHSRDYSYSSFIGILSQIVCNPRTFQGVAGRVLGAVEMRGSCTQPVFVCATAVLSPRVGARQRAEGAILNGISGQGAEVYRLRG